MAPAPTSSPTASPATQDTVNLAVIGGDGIGPEVSHDVGNGCRIVGRPRNLERMARQLLILSRRGELR